VKFGGVQGKWMGIRLVSLLGLGFPMMSRKIVRRVTSLVWVALCERLAVLGENCLQVGEGPFHRRRVLGGSA